MGKYAKYAIGEILLVMIGILLALQVSSWNDERMERKLEVQVLNEILSNLDADLRNLEKKKQLNIGFQERNTALRDHLISRKPFTDSLRMVSNNLVGRGRFQPVTIAYENLKARGIDIVKDDSLRAAISQLYDNQYFYFTDDLWADYELTKELHSKAISNNLIHLDDFSGAEPMNLSALQNDLKFREALTQAIGFYWWMNFNYRKGQRQILYVRRLIIRELEDRQALRDKADRAHHFESIEISQLPDYAGIYSVISLDGKEVSVENKDYLEVRVFEDHLTTMFNGNPNNLMHYFFTEKDKASSELSMLVDMKNPSTLKFTRNAAGGISRMTHTDQKVRELEKRVD